MPAREVVEDKLRAAKKIVLDLGMQRILRPSGMEENYLEPGYYKCLVHSVVRRRADGCVMNILELELIPDEEAKP